MDVFDVRMTGGRRPVEGGCGTFGVALATVVLAGGGAVSAVTVGGSEVNGGGLVCVVAMVSDGVTCGPVAA